MAAEAAGAMPAAPIVALVAEASFAVVDIVEAAPSPADLVVTRIVVEAAGAVESVGANLAGLAEMAGAAGIVGANFAVLVADEIAVAAVNIVGAMQGLLDSMQAIALVAQQPLLLHARHVHGDHCECDARHKVQQAQQLALQ